jgi:hypothetical protein
MRVWLTVPTVMVLAALAPAQESVPPPQVTLDPNVVYPMSPKSPVQAPQHATLLPPASAQNVPRTAASVPATGQNLPPTTLVVPAAKPASSNLVHFDYRTAEVRWIGGRWELQAGGVWLKDFGNNEREARDALRVIQNLRLSERGAIGSPAPIMEYWLSDGKAPHALGSGLRLYPIDHGSVHLDQLSGQWCLRDQRQILFNFGLEKDAARQALDVIKRYGFTQIGYVGYPHPSMIYFLADAAGASRTSSVRDAHIKINHVPQQESASVPVTGKPANSGQSAAPAPGTSPNQGSPTPTQVVEARLAAQQLGKGVRQLSPPLTAQGMRQRFDPRQVALREDNQHWRLFVANHVVADFGADSLQAHRALHVLQQYGCNEQCWVGSSGPVFTYFLVNGHAPLGVPHGLPGLAFRPEQITIQQIPQGWSLCDGPQPLLTVMGSHEDAQSLAQAIQRYHFNYLTPMGPNLTFLARTQ